MKKFRKYGFWVALAGAITTLATALGKCLGLNVDGSLAGDVVMAVAGVLVVLGVVVMPKNKAEKQPQAQENNKDKVDNDEIIDGDDKGDCENHEKKVDEI